MKVGHIVNSFDPSCDVGCVRELNLYSRHSHGLFVRDRHPDQDVYQFEEAPRTDAAEVIAAADVLIYHFPAWQQTARPGQAVRVPEPAHHLGRRRRPVPDHDAHAPG